MNREELKKEAEEYAEQCYGWCNNDQVTDVAIATYITSAEPRENKIADIKANCDLAIEGRDIKIKELEKENKRLKGDLELYESGGCRATNLFKCGVVKELKEQMEKMKCCGNCKYSNQESVYSIVCKVGGVDKSDYINIDDNQVCDKWEIKEND